MLGTYLKEYRITHNLTQAQMADKIGTSQSYYSLLENDRRKPAFSMIKKISRIIKMKPSDIRSIL